MSLKPNLALVLTLTCVMGLAGARTLPPLSEPGIEPLNARLAAGLAADGLMSCWNAMTELAACTDEIVLFFMNGEAQLGLGCCRAIGTITHHCWTDMLGTLGFTAGEGDVLKGYCDAEVAAPPTPTTSEKWASGRD